MTKISFSEGMELEYGETRPDVTSAENGVRNIAAGEGFEGGSAIVALAIVLVDILDKRNAESAPNITVVNGVLEVRP